MVYLGAFVVCGVLCALCQLAKEIVKKANDGQVAIGVMIVGALLVPTGIIAALEGFAQMGICVTVIDAAASLSNGMMSLMSGQGGFLIIFVIAIFTVVTILGLITGAIYDVMHRDKAN